MKKALSILCAACIAAASTAQINVLPRSTAAAQGVEPAALARFVDSMMAVPRTDIHHLMVLRHGKVIAEVHPAPYRADDPHTLFSCSKTFTALAVGIAVDENRLRVTDRVAAFFPQKLPPIVSPELARLTVHDLLTMHTGITPTDVVRNGTDDWVASYLSQEINPEAPYQYDSMCTFVLSAIVQRVTGMTVLDYLKDRLFTPMGITHLDWEHSPDGITAGGWGLRLQAESQAKLALLINNKGNWEGRQLVSEEWLNLMCAKQIDPKPETTPPTEGNQGYGYQIWMCRMPGALRADGAFAQYIVMVPHLDLAVVINSVSYRLNGWIELGHIWDILVPALHDTPVTASKADERKLAKSLERPISSEIPPMRSTRKSAEKWVKNSQICTLTLEDNDWGLKTLNFYMDGDMLNMTVNDDSFAYGAGNGKWVINESLGARNPLPPYNVKAQARFDGLENDFRCAASYGWTGPHTLVIRQEWPTWFAGRTMTIDFIAGTLTLVHNWAQQSPIIIPFTLDYRSRWSTMLLTWSKVLPASGETTASIVAALYAPNCVPSPTMKYMPLGLK